MKAFFFDIFGTLVDWRSSIMEGAKNLKIFKFIQQIKTKNPTLNMKEVGFL